MRQAAAALMARSGTGSGSLSVQEHESSSRSRRKRRESMEDGDSACTCQQSDKTFPAGLIDASPMDAGRRRSARTRNPSHRRAITAADEGSDRGQQEVVRVGKGKGRQADYQIRLSGGASSGDGEDAASSADSALVARPRNRSSRHRDPEESLIYDNHASSSTSKAIHRVLPYLASSSSLPWAIGANDDAPRHALAFTFASDSDIDHDRRIAAPPVDAIPLIAPFLFDNTDGDELHPIGSTFRRASSLPSRLPSRSPTGTLSCLGDADSDIDISQSQSDSWLLSPAVDSTLIPQSPKYESTTSTSNSATSSSSTSSQGGRNNNTNTASQSPPTSPTSSHAECSTSSSCYQGSSSHSHTYKSGSKRSSPSMMLDATRLKKRKLSHRIRSFLLLRPPGLPYPGTDGAADIAHITRAPAWLKNATSQMSRESRMAPHEWYWSGDEIDTDVWTLSQLEKRFKEQLKVNADQEALEKEERESLSDASLMMVEEHSIPSRLNKGDGTHSEIIPITLETSAFTTSAATAASSPAKRNHTKRLRQVSAPPVMEADPEKVANALISPPQHGALPNHPSNRSSMNEASSSSNNALSLPPEVLKSQLLAVLRSRLPEGSKNGDAPLRMKKFVVWNGESQMSDGLTNFR